MGTGSQSAAGSRAPTPIGVPRQALIGFREHPQYGGTVPAWLFSNSLGTLDIDALANGRAPSDQWRWSSDGTSAFYEQNGVVAQFHDVVQLSAPQRDQRLDGVYELVDDDGSTQLMRFAKDGGLTVCDATRRQQRQDSYRIDGFVLDWTRENGAPERHTLLYDPADVSSIWLGSHQLVTTRSNLCMPYR